MDYWFSKKNKSISLRFLPQHWKNVQCSTNGAKKGIDPCYDLNIQILGLFFSYTNWDYTK